jgi:tetraacyldisaccharide 4'-kinase
VLDLRHAIQRRLERGAPPAPSAAWLARGWSRLARLERRLSCSLPVVCVGGATLGGSGKTPLAIACARFLAERGVRVALVGHAYRARPPKAPRRVTLGDDPAVVGDEALECARALEDLAPRAFVLVARRRQDALDAAAGLADVVVLDGPLQLAPRRAALSLLAVDAAAPWGSGACPPLGDLRASEEALLAASDHVVVVGGRSAGARLGGELIPMAALRSVRVGLVTGVARPSRVEAFLVARGVTPRAVVTVADHAPLPRRLAPAEVDVWLTTPKDAARGAPADVAVLDYHLDLPESAKGLLVTRFPFRF